MMRAWRRDAGRNIVLLFGVVHSITNGFAIDRTQNHCSGRGHLQRTTRPCGSTVVLPIFYHR
jgi:hypothetical protein